MSSSFTLSAGGSSYVIDDHGEGPTVVLYPSLGRPGSDFDELATALNASGFRTVAVTPPGFTTPLCSPQWNNLFDIANELKELVDQLEIDSPVVVGHAFGNRVARMYSTLHPESLTALILLACGGEIPPSSTVHEVFLRIFNPSRSDDERERDVREVFFAPSNEVGSWRYGWNGPLAQLQSLAVVSTKHSEFKRGGIAPGLVIQGFDDVIATPENSQRFVEDRPNTKLVNLTDCGHAMLPEQPFRIQQEVIDFLASLR